MFFTVILTTSVALTHNFQHALLCNFFHPYKIAPITCYPIAVACMIPQQLPHIKIYVGNYFQLHTFVTFGEHIIKNY
jgi:hypothetical protein